jgi:hypothetical protein
VVGDSFQQPYVVLATIYQMCFLGHDLNKSLFVSAHGADQHIVSFCSQTISFHDFSVLDGALGL